MRTAQILILVAIFAVLIIVFLIPQLSKNNSSSNTSNTTTPYQTTSNTLPKQASGDVSLSLDPADLSANTGATFTVSIKVDTKSSTVSAVELHLTYDPNFLDATALKNSTFLPVVLAPAKMNSGTASLVVGSTPISPQKGTGIVATATFTAKKAGKTKITIDKTTQVAAIGKNSSVLGSTSDATVTIK